MPRALLSVTDKTGIVDFAQGLAQRGYELVSTGGTARVLRDAGLSVKDVSEITGFPEMLDGRVKTLHPNVHGGLLGDVRLESHRVAMASAGIEAIDVVAVNLYAFEQTVTTPHSPEEAIESIDIGGPAMIRAAAKNHANVSVLVEPADYDRFLAGETDRRELAAKAFRHTAFYDSMVSRYLSDDAYPETLTLGYRRALSLRYGENPHQSAALYLDPLGEKGLANATQLWGKELSYNNLLDADAAWELVCDMPAGACAIIKHGNPCGAAVGRSSGESYRMARTSDPISAFGGIAAFNNPVGEEAAVAMCEKGNFLEVIIAPAFDEAARTMFAERSGWGKDVRLLEAPMPPAKASLAVRSLRGGLLVTETDEDPSLAPPSAPSPRPGRGGEWRVVSESQPSESEMAALKLLWAMIPHVKSNAILVGNAHQMLGVGAGQMNRVQSVRLALEQAGEQSRGASLASDAFFPFSDSIETAAAAGIRAVIQPGGSKKDDDVIAKANEVGIAMVFTGTRHFRH